MLKMAKSFFEKRMNKIVMLSVLAFSAVPIMAFADEEVPKIDTAAVTGAVSTAVNDTITLMSSLLPIALSIFAAIWGVRKAMRFFKSASN